MPLWFHDAVTTVGFCIPKNNSQKKFAKMVRNVIKNEVVPRIPAASKAVGGMIGGSTGAAVGKIAGGALQRKVAKLVGSGDYTLNDAPVRNSLFPGSSNMQPLPSFGGEDNQRVRFREYVTDIVSTGSSDFVIRSLQIQPGMAASFPYLSTIATSFETYRLNGLVYEYVPMVSPYATAAMGSVMMTCSYNSTSYPPSSRSSMENLNGCIVHRPDKASMYGVECEGQLTNGYFVRPGDTLTPNNWEDYGKIYVATAGMSPAQYPAGTVLGELWVTYDIVFHKHRIPLLIPGYSSNSRVAAKASPIGTSDLTAPAVSLGNCYPISFDGTNIYLGTSTSSILGTIAPGTVLDIDIVWTAGTAGTLTPAAPTFTDCTQLALYASTGALAYAVGQYMFEHLQVRIDKINAKITFAAIGGTGDVNQVRIFVYSIGANGSYTPGTQY